MKDKITTLLKSTNRLGIDRLLEYIEKEGYFTVPASTKYHGCYEGGLAKHSFGVYVLLRSFNELFKFGVPEDSIILSTLLHDLCKMGAYLGDSKPYKWNRAQPKGHADLSLTRIGYHITLTPLEAEMVKYHMGPWNAHGPKAEYQGGKDMLVAWGKNPIVKWMYFSDEMATAEEKVEESEWEIKKELK